MHNRDDFGEPSLSCDESGCPGFCSCYDLGTEEGRSAAEWKEESELLEELTDRLEVAVERVLTEENAPSSLRAKLLKLFE